MKHKPRPLGRGAMTDVYLKLQWVRFVYKVRPVSTGA